LPFTPQIVFDVGQLAEPLTGMAVAMLEEQGKLSASDLVKKYLPELPSGADTLTVGHLLYHTSGLADWAALLPLAGWNEGDVITRDQILRLVCRQSKLLFDPGTKFLDSRTDYVLLAEIISRATSQSFREWTWANIFKPLGMTRTQFRDNSREIVENRAYSINYHPRDGYLKGADSLAVVGACSLFTTLEDFTKWLVNFENPRVGSAQVAQKMMTSGKLASGREAGHSYGFSVEIYQGLKRLRKSGAWGGFRATLEYYPDASFGVLVVSNWDYGWYQPESHANSVAAACLEPLMKKAEKTTATLPSAKPLRLSPEALAQYVGEYRLAPGNYASVSQEKTVLVLTIGRQEYRLVPTGEAVFRFEDPNIPVVVTFFKSADGKVTHFGYPAFPRDINAARVVRESLSAEQLKRYEGTYSNEELEVRYGIVARDNRLALSSLRKSEVILTPENRQVFVGNSPGFELITFLVNEGADVTGFRVEAANLPPLTFLKEKALP
ncbi:MAG: serine hydrolase domain-containing protein, partial [Acidobacteriota bacterium]